MSFSFKHFCVCPNCAQAIEENTEYLVCSSCGKNYPIQNGIPILLNHENDQKLREYIECYDQIAEDDLQKPIVSDMQKEIVHGGLLKFIGVVLVQSDPFFFPLEEAKIELLRFSDTQFDPQLVATLLSLLEEKSIPF